jgi:Co/Zn/Cd efflux system component
MSAHCCEHDTPAPQTVIDLPRYRRVLWVALVVNAAMFAIEIIGGIQAGSLSLLAAAVGVFGTGTAWPDLGVAGLMAALALHGGWQVLQQAQQEMKLSAA